jgi:hypothetical protein
MVRMKTSAHGKPAAENTKSCAPALRDPEAAGEADKHYGRIRHAGPQDMRDPPHHWDAVDEGSDESFPASDPLACTQPQRSN